MQETLRTVDQFTNSAILIKMFEMYFNCFYFILRAELNLLIARKICRLFIIILKFPVKYCECKCAHNKYISRFEFCETIRKKYMKIVAYNEILHD